MLPSADPSSIELYLSFVQDTECQQSLQVFVTNPLLPKTLIRPGFSLICLSTSSLLAPASSRNRNASLISFTLIRVRPGKLPRPKFSLSCSHSFPIFSRACTIIMAGLVAGDREGNTPWGGGTDGFGIAVRTSRAGPNFRSADPKSGSRPSRSIL